MKAYRVWSVNDEWQELVFAPHHNTAKKAVVDDLGSAWPQDLRAARLPHMDGYGDPFFVRGYVDRNSHLQRLSGIYPCALCGGKNGDGGLVCAKCEDA